MTSADSERLDDYRFQWGRDAGNLAMALDHLTDVVQVVGQHTVYCRVEKGPRAGEPPLDIEEVLRLLAEAKGLVQESLLRLKAGGEGPI